MSAYLSAREASAELGVSTATLYAYVSRGLVRSESDGASRRRRYLAEDIWALKRRKAVRRDPTRAAKDALHWGLPVLESRVSVVEEGRLYYRGKDVVQLAGTSAFERVLGLLWRGDVDTTIDVDPAEARPLWSRLSQATKGLAPLKAFQTAMPIAASTDSRAYDLREERVALVGARILAFMTMLAAASPSSDGATIARRLKRAWAPRRRGCTALLDAAMILYADNGLSPSTFTARCVASAGSSPYAVVTAGLAALQGAKHGGASDRAEAMLREARDRRGAQRAVADRLERGEAIPGFGHPRYPDGDPRGALLMELVAKHCGQSREAELAANLSEAVLDLMGDRPNVDFGVVTLCRALGLPDGAPHTLLALGRTAGWIAHALEQYDDGKIIRPRARYSGEPPEGS